MYTTTHKKRLSTNFAAYSVISKSCVIMMLSTPIFETFLRTLKTFVDHKKITWTRQNQFLFRTSLINLYDDDDDDDLFEWFDQNFSFFYSFNFFILIYILLIKQTHFVLNSKQRIKQSQQQKKFEANFQILMKLIKFFI